MEMTNGLSRDLLVVVSLKQIKEGRHSVRRSIWPRRACALFECAYAIHILFMRNELSAVSWPANQARSSVDLNA